MSCKVLIVDDEKAVRDLFDPRLRGGLGRYGGMTQEKLLKLAEQKQAEIAKRSQQA